MRERKHIFLTGATGFLGSHLAYELLVRGHRITALARSAKTSSARERVEEALQQVVLDDAAFHEHVPNLTVVEGDIAHESMGLSGDARKSLAASVDEVWHCAASLSFTQEDRDEIIRMNVGGTQNVLDFVREIRSHRLHHVSTAYVAGNRTDEAGEDQIDVGQTFKNAYEESKCSAELLVQKAHRTGAAQASVYRPSIVIGDSKTGRVTHFHGVYAFIRGLWGALERLRRRLPEGSVVHLPLRVLGSESTTLNFVPIDYVVDGMLAIAASESSIGGTYHLTNPHPTENRMWLPNICDVLGFEGIQLVDESSFSKEPMTRLEAMFQKQMAFYYMYLQGEPRFDCRHTLDALKDTTIRCPEVTVEFIRKMAGWYVGFLNRAARAREGEA